MGFKFKTLTVADGLTSDCRRVQDGKPSSVIGTIDKLVINILYLVQFAAFGRQISRRKYAAKPELIIQYFYI